jgi:CubicO group peptidase (beta-lactamase class C family)
MIRPATLAVLAALTCLLAGNAEAQAPSPYQAIVDAAVANSGFNGVALVGQRAQAWMVDARGTADAAGRRPMQPDTLFEVGSVSKWVAAIVVLHLVDRGTLDLDAPILRYLPDYRHDTGAQLTLRQLLRHASGVPNGVNAARQADPAMRAVELDQMEAVRRYASGDLAFAPGTQWDYAHANWIIVKAIVERATGKDYARLVDEILVRPLRLRHSGLVKEARARPPGMAASYATLVPTPVPKESLMPRYMAMAGGYYASAPDLLALMDGALGGDAILSAASRRALTTVTMPAQHYALGGRTRVATIAGCARETAWQDGSNAGYRVLARRVLADGHSVVIMTNASFDYQALDALGTALLDASYPAPRTGQPCPPPADPPRVPERAMP